ncbi:hypothetical protein BT63DRAFT_1787 [Microthyrium microscopicum]|uniref:Uncharacterized protein n=1 Tax=Microthyrium microscopicum TaxID=703497 RepID=A0A6A6UPB0_9PEZI|nr:hypothetical protein BT63DRAFT_1787 [Microthyrium microscopicum]
MAVHRAILSDFSDIEELGSKSLNAVLSSTISAACSVVLAWDIVGSNSFSILEICSHQRFATDIKITIVESQQEFGGRFQPLPHSDSETNVTNGPIRAAAPLP